MNPEQEALDFLQSGIEFAYQQGLHEVGYDPVAVIRAALSQAAAYRVALQEINGMVYDSWTNGARAHEIACEALADRAIK